MSKKIDKSGKRIRKELLALHEDVIAKRVRYHNAYQPISIGPIRSKITIRDCDDRWAVVEKIIHDVHAKNLVDLGCAEGYFVRKAGEIGVVAIGIDRDYNRLGLIENARMFDRSPNSGYILGSLDPQTLQKLPKFDVVLCFSVMHHVIRHNSMDYAKEVIKIIHSKTGSRLVFDMGQTTEVSTSWASVLPDMGEDPTIWISNFLREGGFTKVDVVGQTDAYRDDVPRFVFECSP